MPIEELEKLHREVVSAIRNDATIHFIGNGGSAATPSHSAGDWSKELRVRTLCHVDNVASLTASRMMYLMMRFLLDNSGHF